MAYSDELIRKKNEYETAYNQVLTVADKLLDTINELNSMVGEADYYFVNDINICGNYLSNVSDNLNNYYNYITQTVIPSTVDIINQYVDAINEQLRIESGAV